MNRCLLLLLAAGLLAGCASGPRTVPLADLAFEADDYDGDTVATSGVVVEFDTEDGALERHFVIQDTDANRVKLEPDEAAEPHVGRIVRVTGEFTFDETVGRILQVDDITPAGDR